MAERSKALAQGASPQGRGFEPDSCQFLCLGFSRVVVNADPKIFMANGTSWGSNCAMRGAFIWALDWLYPKDAVILRFLVRFVKSLRISGNRGQCKSVLRKPEHYCGEKADRRAAKSHFILL